MSVIHRLPGRPARSLVAVACSLMLALPAVVTHAQESSTAPAVASEFNFNIPAQDLRVALIEFWRQSNQELLYSDTDVAGKTSHAVNGAMDRNTALTTLLSGSGLEFEATPSGGLMIADRATLDAQKARSGASAIPSETAAPVITEAGAADLGSTVSVDTARTGGIEEIIVTGQKREERIQDVPIAISAFSSEDLNSQKIEGGFDLLRAVPNVTFSKTNFTGYNFQIRGIGTQAISATTDPGVAVSFNNTTLIVNRLFEQEYLDIERVEVLRGPQGTLFGRNATAGVINVISAKPSMGVHEGSIKLETGNYETQRLRAHYNLPIGEDLALRGAFASTVRDGYGKNEFDGSDVDNRDLWTGRLSLGWQPHERLRANLLWERFREDDQRVRSIKQLCHRDEGLTHVAGLAVSSLSGSSDGYTNGELLKGQLTQGCLPGSLYDEAAFGVPNGLAIPFVSVGRLSGLAGTVGYNPYLRAADPAAVAPCKIYETRSPFSFINLCHEDPFSGAVQSRNLRTISSEIKPTYYARSDIFELSLDFDISDELLLSSQTVYVRDGVRSTQDMNRFATTGGFFEDTSATCRDHNTALDCEPGNFARPVVGHTQGVMVSISPGGIFCDPQLGCSDRYRAVDLSRSQSTQFNQELRLVSSFDGPLNFSVGANFTRFTTLNDYFVFINSLTALSMTAPFRGVVSGGGATGNATILCRPDGVVGAPPSGELIDCLYRDPQTLDQLAKGGNPEGHNYFLSRNPYELNSAAAFGELYWNVTDTLKVTGGLRFTWDQKTFTPVPSQALLSDYRKGGSQFTDPSQCVIYSISDLCARMGTGVDGRGYPADPDIVQEWREPTGRLGFDWKPDLSLDWLDESLIYAFYTRGYKAGGANPPGMAEPARSFIERAQGAVMPRVFKAEYVNAFEIGTKNRLFGNTLTANANLFYYDYENYQVSKIVNRTSANENFDAKIWGAELELMFAPWQYTLFNASVGYLRTRIADGEQSIDLMDRTQGGGSMFITGQANPDFDPTQPARAREDYVAGLNAPADQEYLAFDDWVLIKPSVLQTSNCIAPAALVRTVAENYNAIGSDLLSQFCPGGNISAYSYSYQAIPGTNNVMFDPLTDAPNGGAGFMADLGGHELPSAPRYTVSLGAQQSIPLPGGWDITGRVDWYWQDQSYARVYNTEYDRLRDWTNTNLSLWVEQPAWGLRFETYIKNVFNQTPITGTFLGSDDTALPTNIFTLDPRLIGVSVTKQF